MIKQNGHLLALAALLVVSACGGDTKLPNPTGKASVRAINAIPGSPEVSFLIEERNLGSVGYKNVTPTQRYDDFSYTFNFEVVYAGDDEATRFASQQIDFTAGADYTLLLTGSLTAPAISVFESVEREFDAGATVFQARFAHSTTNAAWGAVDVYFAPDGTAPVPGEQVATLAFGEVSAPVDFESGDYVVIYTVPKNPGETIDPADILYTSTVVPFPAQSQIIVTPFDGDANDTAPVVVRALLGGGSNVRMDDPSFPGTVHFLHSSIDLGASDIYDDESLTSQVVSNHVFMDVTPDIDVPVPGDITYSYTPTGSTAAVTLEAVVEVVTGLNLRVVALGSAGTYSRAAYVNDRAPVATAVKLNTFHASDNYGFLSFYAVEPGEDIDGEFPFRASLARSIPTPPALLAAGTYDIYVTETGETDILAGPLQIDVQLGDVLDVVVFDTADPAVLEMRLLP